MVWFSVIQGDGGTILLIACIDHDLLNIIVGLLICVYGSLGILSSYQYPRFRVSTLWSGLV